jgi:FtsH-binding integral membrane protein
MNAPISQTPATGGMPSRATSKLHWPWFALALLVPPILTFATALAGWTDFPVICPFVGGGLAGLVCGILLGRRLGRTTPAVVLLSVLFVLIFAAVSFCLCFGGCLVGNYKLDMR